MLIVVVKKGNIEKSLKELKGKVIRTKQNSKLFNGKELREDLKSKKQSIPKN